MVDCFVLVAAGDEHCARLDLSLRALQKFCPNHEVIVVTDRPLKVQASHLVVRSFPADMDDVVRGRFLKTDLLRHLPEHVTRACYIDNDVLAVSPKAAEIFESHAPPVSFADDHFSTPKTFGRWALYESHPSYPNLALALLDQFEVQVDEAWRLWNGGVFTFDRSSSDFFSYWSKYTNSILSSEDWMNRDQGSLVAAVWKLGLQHHTRLPISFNWLVRHSKQVGGDIEMRDNRFYDMDSEEIAFLHFIPGHGSGYSADCWEWRACVELIDS